MSEGDSGVVDGGSTLTQVSSDGTERDRTQRGTEKERKVLVIIERGDSRSMPSLDK